MKHSGKKPKGRKNDAIIWEARSELLGIRDAMESAYSIFNSTADPELLEASILEIGALQTRYSRMLRDLKNISEAQT